MSCGHESAPIDNVNIPTCLAIGRCGHDPSGVAQSTQSVEAFADTDHHRHLIAKIGCLFELFCVRVRRHAGMPSLDEFGQIPGQDALHPPNGIGVGVPVPVAGARGRTRPEVTAQTLG